MTGGDKILFDAGGRAYRMVPYEKQIPVYALVGGRFVGKFYSDKVKSDFETQEFYDFKIYEGEVEILYRNRFPDGFKKDKSPAIKISAEQLPDKIYYFERKDGNKIYYDLSLQNTEFHNFEFIKILHQTDENESFGTVQSDVFGYIVQYHTEIWHRKEYLQADGSEYEGDGYSKNDKNAGDGGDGGRRITTDGQGNTPPPPPPPRPSSNNTAWSACRRNIFFASAITLFGLLFGFVPLFVIGLVWLLYLINKCYFRWLRILLYLFGFLFLAGLIFSVLNTNWSRPAPYIPRTETAGRTRPQLVKVIRAISKDGKTEDILITHRMSWFDSSGQRFQGEYSIKKSDLDASRSFKNQLSYKNSYPAILYQLSNQDSDRLGGLYKMFDGIRANRPMDGRAFADMVVGFVQNIPYYVVLEKGCSENEYAQQSIKQLIRENAGKCCPNQKFGITSPVEFMANLQGDCDSRTVLLYTILKHYNIGAAIFSSDVYSHSLLGVALPYSGIKYSSGGTQYTLWETTDRYAPGNLPLQITNLDNWYLTLK